MGKSSEMTRAIPHVRRKKSKSGPERTKGSPFDPSLGSPLTTTPAPMIFRSLDAARRRFQRDHARWRAASSGWEMQGSRRWIKFRWWSCELAITRLFLARSLLRSRRSRRSRKTLDYDLPFGHFGAAGRASCAKNWFSGHYSRPAVTFRINAPAGYCVYGRSPRGAWKHARARCNAAHGAL